MRTARQKRGRLVQPGKYPGERADKRNLIRDCSYVNPKLKCMLQHETVSLGFQYAVALREMHQMEFAPQMIRAILDPLEFLRPTRAADLNDHKG